MTRVRILLAIVTLLLAAPMARAADRYVTGMEDVPLMAGLAPVEVDGVAFDSAGGRIVIAYARGAVEKASVLEFYRRSLSQLGWRARGPASFAREGETLTIDFAAPAGKPKAEPASKGGLTVRFTLSPL